MCGTLFRNISRLMIQKTDFGCRQMHNGNMHAEETRKDIDTAISMKLHGSKKIRADNPMK